MRDSGPPSPAEFNPLDVPAELPFPERFPSPFDESGPHPLAALAAGRVIERLRSGWIAPGWPTSLLHRPTGGKMFGVLVAQDPSGKTGFLQACSGILDGAWDVPGFAPPIFDREARVAVEGPGERVVSGLTARVEAYRNSGAVEEAKRLLSVTQQSHAQELDAFREDALSRKASRHDRRRAFESSLATDVTALQAALHTLDQESRMDKAARRAMEERQGEELAAVKGRLKSAERRARALDRLRAYVSRELMKRIHDTYETRNNRGERRPLRELFAGQEPPGGAGDCAGPKLLDRARVLGLRPLALAEFWWGPPPATGGRLEGNFYPACRPKCGPLLPFMLEGLDVAPPVKFTPPPSVETGLRFLHRDDALLVLEKPVGVLSIPGRGQALRDSIEQRLKDAFPEVDGPILVHRLDLDTSGLLLGTLDRRSHASLHKQFERREVKKRYVAWVEGEVRGDSGTIDLPIRVDVDDRPRQVHDPVHGLAAVTDWQVLERQAGRTKLALFPRTGRTHQLRVHCAHPLGLGAPIVGDRLYGRAADRLLLHAEWVEFTHPTTGERVAFSCPAPF